MFVQVLNYTVLLCIRTGIVKFFIFMDLRSVSLICSNADMYLRSISRYTILLIHKVVSQQLEDMFLFKIV